MDKPIGVMLHLLLHFFVPVILDMLHVVKVALDCLDLGLHILYSDDVVLFDFLHTGHHLIELLIRVNRNLSAVLLDHGGQV